ncbi:acetylpolyamine amidohydrolase [bacterium CG_4_9_14_3_um_filter_65_15]|nr:MAG: acetylpolyamine amidohydrolase [bacterium CG_4_9_14_3_um_filter_65_15]
MFRIRRIHDDLLPVNKEAIRQVQSILDEQFPGLAAGEREKIISNLRDPFAQRFRAILHVAEKQNGPIQGFALVLHEPTLNFFYLDYIASRAGLTSRGIGGALYQRIREEALASGTQAVYFECLPDDPADCKDKKDLAANRARLRFYEHFGARPLIDNDYTKPLSDSGDDMPYLVVDTLGNGKPPRRKSVQAVARAILERKYATLCPPEYVEAVVASFREDPVPLREPRYQKPKTQTPVPPPIHLGEKIVLYVNAAHDIHHVHDRGYVEAPVRVRRIMQELDKTAAFELKTAPKTPLEVIKQVHDRGFVEYVKKICLAVPEGQSVYPYVFPIRNASRPPIDLAMRAGYYCIDTFTPLNRNAFLAARGAVDCALAGAGAIRDGHHLAYALVRPPGHHAERRVFGGFCYFNNSALAAQALSELGRVAVLDVDYHHGNGTQDIFSAREDVLTVSIHGHPRFAYPYFSGFAEEQGEGAGMGFNLNLPLPEQVDGTRYHAVLDKALGRIRRFSPVALVVALGLDPAKGDPTGTWSLLAGDFHENGRRIGALGLPTLVVQEGGYRTRTLGVNARSFFEGMMKGSREK